MSSGAKIVPPSINETAFNCPHCGALAKQTWFQIRADAKSKDGKPTRLSEETVNWELLNDFENPEQKEKIKTWMERMIAGSPFIDSRKSEYFGSWDIFNLDISRCYNCDEIAVWVASSLVYPRRGEAPPPNSDLPADVRADYDEAGLILQSSPRGAAALLRLAIQKICKQLGGKGKNIDNDIAYLVSEGLDKRVQQSLDIVRVVGNESVHPGQIDLRDDSATAERLFVLVNLIADIMISQPKQIDEMYNMLPQGKREAIEKRDGSK